jgi:hypothetical protein
MDGLPRISPAQVKEFLHSRVDDLAEKLVENINQAQSGRLIADTEELTRKLIHEFGQAAYQAVLQAKVDAAEAAFSPSRGDADRRGHRRAGDQAAAE